MAARTLNPHPGIGPGWAALDGADMSERKRVLIWTDGACVGNPGPGGYAAVLRYGEHRRELSGGYRRTTNNRMELTAAIAALRCLKESCEVTLFSDSRYLIDGVMQGWARRWREAGWARKDQRVPNADLWAELLELCERHAMTLEWVRGHAADEENERCDVLAVRASLGEDLPMDVGYEDPDSLAPLARPQLSLFA
jgi:ribonuclease HI